MSPAEAAKIVFICFRQLEELLRQLASDGRDYASVCHTVSASVPTYNAILSSLKECFAIDREFAQRIDHLQPLSSENEWETIRKMSVEGAVLRGSAHAFIELYLSPEERKKAIGFHA